MNALRVIPIAAAVAALMGPAPSQSTQFSGLPHAAVGQAQLAVTPAGLTVSNIGSSGLDGVRIDLGSSPGLVTRMRLDPASTPVGAGMESRFTSTLNGATGQPGGSLGLVRTASGYEGVPDFGPLGAITYTATVLRDGQLVASQSGLSQPIELRFGVSVDIACDCAPWSWCWTITIDIQFRLGGAGPVLTGNGIVFTPDVTPGPGALERVEVTGLGGTSSFTIDSESLLLDRLPVSALGNAQLTGAGGEIVISNIGSMGLDGVDVRYPPRTRSASMRFADLDALSPQPAGAELRVHARGSLGGAPSSSLGEIAFTQMPGGAKRITADYGATGATSLLVEIFNGGSLVTSMPMPLGFIASVPNWPTRCRKVDIWWPQPFPCFAPSWPFPLAITLPGLPPVTGDEMRILAQGTQAVAELDAMQLSGTNLTELRVQATSFQQGYTTYGRGCGGAAGPLVLLPAGTGTGPRIGSPFSIDIGPVASPQTIAAGAIGFAPTAVNLALIGAPDCDLLLNPVVTRPLNVGPTGSLIWTLTIPSTPSLVGVVLYQQGLVIEIGANALGVITSNGGRGVVGA